MKIEFVYFTVLWLNAFPVKTGKSSTYLPQEILVRWRLDYKKHCRVLPGTYCKVHDEPGPLIRMVGLHMRVLLSAQRVTFREA